MSHKGWACNDAQDGGGVVRGPLGDGVPSLYEAKVPKLRCQLVCNLRGGGRHG